MLLSDGSVTRHLQLLTGVSVAVDCMQMAAIGPHPPGLPPGAAHLQGDLVQRQVTLRSGRPQSECLRIWQHSAPPSSNGTVHK